MSKKHNKTNAARLLDKSGIEYEQLAYGKENEFLSGTEVADLLNEDPDKVYKTLVTKSQSGHIYVAVIPSHKELDLKKLAKAANEKKIDMLPQDDIIKVTGYIKGGCSPIGMKKRYPTFIEESGAENQYIYCSAGKRGLQIKLSPDNLAEITDADFVDLIK